MLSARAAACSSPVLCIRSLKSGRSLRHGSPDDPRMTDKETDAGVAPGPPGMPTWVVLVSFTASLGERMGKQRVRVWTVLLSPFPPVTSLAEMSLWGWQRGSLGQRSVVLCYSWRRPGMSEPAAADIINGSGPGVTDRQ
jgi:hypothetical protein